MIRKDTERQPDKMEVGGWPGVSMIYWDMVSDHGELPPWVNGISTS